MRKQASRAGDLGKTDYKSALKDVSKPGVQVAATKNSTPTAPETVENRGNTQPVGKGIKPKGKRKETSTYISQDAAVKVVKPSVLKVFELIRKYGLSVVSGWHNRLTRTFVRLERGSYASHRSRFWPKLGYEQLAHKCVQIAKDVLTRWTSADASHVSEVLLGVEQHQSEKIGERGAYPPWSTWGDKAIEEIYAPKPQSKNLDKVAYAKSLADLASMGPKIKLRVQRDSWKEGLEHSDRGESSSQESLDVTTNSGQPSIWVTKWFHRIKEEASPIQLAAQKAVIHDCELLWNRLWESKSLDEAKSYVHFISVAHQRTNVATGYKATKDNTYKGHIISRLRAVNAMYKTDTVCGKPFSIRLIKYVTEHIVNPDGTRPFTALTTPERIAKNMEVMLQTCHEHNLIPLGADFSGYDKSIPPWLAWDVAKAVSTWFEPRSAKIFLALVWGVFFQTSTLTPTKFVEEGPSSMKSGSWLTNILDSLINLVVQRYGLHAGYLSEIHHQFVQGDDAILSGPLTPRALKKFKDLPHAFEAWVSDFGLVGNADKQFYTRDMCSFCQLVYVRGIIGGIYPISRATASIASTEDDLQLGVMDYRKFIYVTTYRTLMRANNACFNPAFERWLNWLKADGDTELHLGANIPASKLAKLVGSSEIAKLEALWINKPWQSTKQLGFDKLPINRVLHGEKMPPVGRARFEWVWGVNYDKVNL